MKKIKSLFGILMSLFMTISLISVPVLAANPSLIDTTQKVTVNIHKYELTETQLEELKQGNVHDTGEELASPPSYLGLEGVKFSYYQVGAIGETENHIKTRKSTLTGITTSFALGENGLPVDGCYAIHGETDATDGNGLTSFEINADGTGAQMGLYYVVETQSPEHVTTKTDPFFVYLPMSAVNKNTWNYNVHLYPKNATTLGAVIFSKIYDFSHWSDLKSLPENVVAQYKLQYRDIDTTIDPSVADSWTDMTDEDGKTKICQTINGGYYHSKIVVNNLPVNQYRFIEIGVFDVDPYTGTLTPSTTIGVNYTSFNNFKVNKGDTGFVDIDKCTETGTVCHLYDYDYTLPAPSKSIQVNDSTSAEHNGYNVGDTVTWNISSNIPLNIGSYSKFIVRDVLPISKLTYTGDADVVVKAGNNTLKKDTDYKIITSINENDFTLEVDFIGVEGVASYALKSAAGSDLNVSFKTTINKEGKADVIENEGEIDFNTDFHDYGISLIKKTNKTEIHYDGVKFIKQADKASIALQGAEFTLYPTEADAKAGTNPVATAISDENGYFEFVGLAYGNVDDDYKIANTTYCMVEIKAPDGYQLTNGLTYVPIQHNFYQITNANPITIRNSPDIKLPLTGGIGTLIFTILGIAFITVALILLIRIRKDKTNS